MARGAQLDTRGLQEQVPAFAYNRNVTDGTRRYTAPGAATVGGRLVPRTFRAPDGILELRLIEHRTRPGTRAICEIVPRRALTRAESDALLRAWRAMMAEAQARGGWTPADLRSDATVTREGMTTTDPNIRACPVIASLTLRPAEGSFRSSVSEMAGAPDCGGASLLDLPARPRPGSDT